MRHVEQLKGEIVHGKYCITEPIDAGSFGWVFKADHLVLGQSAGPVAIKILKDELPLDERVLREVRYQKQCSHRHVIQVHESGLNHDAGQLERRYFIAMELADESLHARLERGPLTVDEARKILTDVCAGLAHLHARSVVHRDLKPANILCVDGVWKLSDFGLARAAGHLGSQSRRGGTPLYSPPEDSDDELEPSFDMWSFGCVLHECLVGHLPTFTHNRTARLDRSLPAEFNALVSSCLTKDPSCRPSAVDCLKALDPTATPIFSRDDGTADCFLCDPQADRTCARAHLKGTLGSIRKVRDGFECLVYSAGDLEAVPLLLTETWAELGERLHAQWKAFSRRPHPVTLSAFHLQTRRGLRATDDSLVVLDPDWLVSVTDLRDVHGCERVRLLDRFEVFRPGLPVVIGDVVNDLFPTLWQQPSVDREHVEREVALHSRELAQVDQKLTWVHKNVNDHLARLGKWTEEFKKHPYELATETTVIAPELGLKGRIDALWFRDDEPVALGELKTGTPREKDELQLSAYGLMLASRGEIARETRSMLLYSKPGTDSDVERLVPLQHHRFRQAMVARNKVLMLDAATEASHDERHCDTCVRFKKARVCTLLGHLFDHQDPRSSALRETLTTAEEQSLRSLAASERRFFEEHHAKIQAELLAVRSKQARLWSCSAEQREREGRAMRFQRVMEVDRDGPRLRYVLLAGRNANHSQLSPDDRVTVSGLDGPTQGRIVIGSVVATNGDGIEIACNEPLPFTEGWASTELDDWLLKREFMALFEWIVKPTAVRDAVIQGRPPTFDPLPRGWKLPAGHDLNDQQKEAVELSVRMRDYLLVLGPPGAGKTTLLRAMVEAHLALGRRILVSANSNRALDQIVRTLLKGDLEHEVLRLGRLNGTPDDVRACALDSLYNPAGSIESQVSAIRYACANRHVVAATASSLAAGDFENVLGKFDLVIVDEATQVSLPLSLGPLRYADRFVLVGDPHQLAPIRSSAEDLSLFQLLANRIKDAWAEGLVELRDQYRMNAQICRIPSDMWYDKGLRPGTPAVASARLAVNLRKIPSSLRPVVDPKRPVVFLDVASDFAHGPRMNEEEARRVTDIVAALLDADPSLPQRVDDRLGILAPYRAQVACIRNHLAERLPRDVDGRHWVDTVDRFQGGERDIVIFSLVGAPHGSVPEHLRDQRRLNVALSRARHKLIVIGDHDFLARDPLYARLFAVMAAVDPDYRLRQS